MKSRANINEQHVEKHGPNNAAWDACTEERHRLAIGVRALARRALDLKDQYDGIVWAYKLYDHNANGIHGHQHAYGVRREHRRVYRSLINLAEELEK